MDHQGANLSLILILTLTLGGELLDQQGASLEGQDPAQTVDAARVQALQMLREKHARMLKISKEVHSPGSGL